MCTVVIEVPSEPDAGVRILAVRDEDPTRPWDPPGFWWPEHAGVLGVRDRQAGGAWLAASREAGRLAVILNRADVHSRGLPAATNGLVSRGALVLDAVAGVPVADPPGTAGFNLVTVAAGRVTVTSWDGVTLVRRELPPGVHMVAHHDVNDRRSARIEAWLPDFRQLAGLADTQWRERWLAVLARSANLPVGDDRAIIRDNRGHGYPTLSLLVCTAEVWGGGSASGAPAVLQLESAALNEPAVWAAPVFQRA